MITGQSAKRWRDDFRWVEAASGADGACGYEGAGVRLTPEPAPC